MRGGAGWLEGAALASHGRGLQLLGPSGVDLEADHVVADLHGPHGEGEADVAQADDSHLFVALHVPSTVRIRFLLRRSGGYHARISAPARDLCPLARLSPHQKRYAFHRWQHVYLWPFYGLMAVSWQLVGDYR